jgi:hypothetical protein
VGFGTTGKGTIDQGDNAKPGNHQGGEIRIRRAPQYIHPS